ncbi:MAG: SDR family NAD(P)-dependent oxidoreductase [Rhodocyclales bacterium]|nr:SDR family NAD(P)-dependent oxidoreductase [Rhodocyclales bacterium]
MSQASLSDPTGTPATALTPLQRAFLALQEAQARVAALEGAAREPIAVIGLGVRAPGNVVDGASFWKLMHEQVDAIGPVPADRWDADALFDPDPDVPGRIATRHGGFLGAVDGFDPGFFSIAPREAQGMDPQQRMLLEVAWEALENAGQAPDRLEHSATGVFIGMCSSDYAYMQLMSEDRTLLDAHFTSGIAHSIMSGRLSYLLGLQGPSVTIDTACSSSLVSVHLACQSLRSGESRMALAGGVNLILSPDLYIALSHSRMLAPDGRCKTFDASADGFARGEGCGIVVLKRLRDAQADGDRILAVIRGSAVNQDGPSSSLTAPNGPAQEAVIRAALAQAGVAPADVGFIEAHGTGTQLGDPLEVHALGAVFGPDRDPQQPLLIGSVKTNIGHLEGAAGVTGLIKLVLALQHKTIPAHLHFRTPSPHISWSDWPVRVPAQETPWMPIRGHRIGGVSSFGFSGTNAHLIVEEAPASAVSTVAERPAHLLTISARDEKALAELAGRLAAALEHRPDTALADFCFTANAGRSHFAQRATILAHDADELSASLRALAAGQSAEGLRTARVTRRDPPRFAFLYTGQGAQYPGMARELYDTAPVFRAALDRCAELLAPLLPRPLLEVMFAADAGTTQTDSKAIDETAYTQPALFALEYALTELWRSWGVTPSAVIGHSVGEYAAACAAGVLTLEDAARLIAHRGRLMQALPAGGAMAAIFVPEAEIRLAIAPHAARVSVAAVNGPEQTVISGAADVIDAICRQFVEQGVRCQRLPVSHAFHSPLIDPVLDAFEREAASAKFCAPRLRLVSNLTGRIAQAEEITRARYWREHVREAVRFGDGLDALAALKLDAYVEIGPHPTLLSFAGTSDGGAGPALVASLRKGKPDWEQMLGAIASLYLTGAKIDWPGVEQGRTPRLIELPTYPFQRERYWFQARPVQARQALRGQATGHPLLGTRLRSASSEKVFEAQVSADRPAFVRQHRVQGHVVMPATAYLDTLLAAAAELLGPGPVWVEDVAVKEAMLLDDDGAERVLQVVAASNAHDGSIAASLSSSDAGADDAAPWIGHVSARLRAGASPSVSSLSLAAARQRCPQAVTSEAFYADFEQRGLTFGPGFRALRKLSRGEAQALGEVELAADLAREAGAWRMHPVLLDGCLQVMAAALADEAGDALYLPIGIGRYALLGTPGSKCWSHVQIQAGGAETRRAQIHVYSEAGELLARLEDVQLKRVGRDALGRLGERWLDDCLYETQWLPRELPVSIPVLARAASAAMAGLREAARLDAYDQFLPRLEALCADYVEHTVRQLGWTPVPGETFVATALADQLRVATRHRRLFGRLLAILNEAGQLERSASGWTVARALATVQPARTLVELRTAHPCGEVELEFTGRVASEFAQALRGEVEPMQLLFPGGSLDTAERLYRDTPTAQFYNGLMAEVIAAAAGARSSGRVLRILEIGAGTGGTTAHVVPRLPAEGVEYTFTDIGPLFVAKARERFGARGFMRFQVLDLERDPQAQGLAPASFDIVIASNVIHATADLRHTLGRVRELLTPGGLLAMLEVTAPQRWFDLTVGLTDGWWAFTDSDLRTDYATLPREAWFRLLESCGFESSTALPEGKAQHGTLALQSLFLARKSVSDAAHADGGDWLLFADQGGLAEGLAQALRARGERCAVVRAGAHYAAAVGGGDDVVIDPTSAADYRRLLLELRAAGCRIGKVLHCWNLDAPAWDATSASALAAAQTHGVVSAMLLAQALVAQAPVPRLWITTRGGQQAAARDRGLAPAQASVWGLGKALALEHPELRCTCVDLDPDAPLSDVDALLAEFGESGSEAQIAWRAGERRIARLARVRRAAEVQRPGSYRLAPSVRGSLDEFGFEPLERRAPGPGEVEIAVEATGLNFKDVLNVLGMYPGDPGPLGGECAGRVTAVGAGVTRVRPGDDVLAVAGGSFSSHVLARADFVQLRPPGISAQEGAAFPIAFLTAEFCLGYLAGMLAGERVLIHAAAGGVGMAAVRLAQRAGATVFATAGSAAKRAILHSMGVEHVFDSRSDAFADEILALTDGRGIDIVLNSLSGDLIDASFRALARGGRLVEIGKRGIKTPEWVEAQDRDWRYFIVDWGETGAREPALIGGMLERLVDELRNGTLTPLPRHVFALDDAQHAFRFMAQAQHIGKIVVTHRAPAPVAIRRDGSYLVTGGLSGLGLVVARWLAERGAGRLVLVGRRGLTPEAAAEVDALRALGSEVTAESADVGDETALADLLARVRRSGPPLRGIVHSAGVLADAGLLQQDAARYATVFAPKVQGGYLLDALTRADPLDCFVLFSSVAAVLGSAGQSNHSAANAFLDLLARERHSRGLPGLSINWGAWTEVGAAVDRGVAERVDAMGLGAVTPAQGLQALERLLGQDRAQVAVLPADWRRYFAQARYVDHAGKPCVPAFLADLAAGAAGLANAATLAAEGSRDQKSAAAVRPVDLREQLTAAAPGRRRSLVAAFVRERALRALGVDQSRAIDPRTPLGELGLDSLLAVELRNTLGTALGQSLPATLLFDYPTIDALTDYLLDEVLQLGEPAVSATAVPAGTTERPTSTVGAIEELSDDEVDRLLAQRVQRKGAKQ